MKNNLLKSYWFYLIGIFFILALPLVSAPPFFHPAPWGKSILFRIAFTILFFFFLWQVLFSKKQNYLSFLKKSFSWKSNLFWPFFLLISLFGLFSLATIFSLDPHFSFWGSPYRGGGFLTLGMIMVFSIFLFLVVRKKDWPKLVNFAISVGNLTAIIAIFQKFGWLSKYMRAYHYRPVSTMGGPIFFALYLTLLIFITFSLALANRGKKKIFYFFSSVLLLIGLILAATRAAFFGVFIAFLFFILAFPKRIGDKKYNKKLFWLKIATLIFIALGVLGVFSLKSQPKIIETLEQNKIIGTTFKRTWSIIENPTEKMFLSSRGSGWKVAFQALKKRPWLGYGPENFSIGFDKFYNPNLPGIEKQPGGSSTGYWDRGHNFIFDIGVTTGLPALIVYLLLFATLFWQLEKIKMEKTFSETSAEADLKHETEQKIIAHGIQATFIAYLVSDLFSFDVFSTYLMLFFIIAYSFHFIYSAKNNSADNQKNEDKRKEDNESGWKKGGKYAFISAFAIFSVVFIQSGNIRPLLINKKLNQYVFLSQKIYDIHYKNPSLAQKEENALLEKMDDLLKEKSFIDNYVRLQYIDIISKATSVMPRDIPELSLKAIKILRQCQKLRPDYTRSWLYNVIYINKYLGTAKKVDPKLRRELNEEAKKDINRAKELSPKRPQIFVALAKNYMANKEFEKAKNQAKQCLEIAPRYEKCWWVKILSLTALGKIESADEAINQARKNGLKTETKETLSELVSVYAFLVKKTGSKKYYRELANIYEKLIALDRKKVKEIKMKENIKIPENFQYHASLAYIYKILGEYKKAREEALLVEKLSPKSKRAVESFLRTLPSKK